MHQKNIKKLLLQFNLILSIISLIMKSILYNFFLLLTWILVLGNSSQYNGEWVAPEYSDTLTNPLSGKPKAIADGKKIYENACWTCHGLEGKGDGPAALKLSPKPADHTSQKVQNQTDGAIFWKLSKGKGDMPPFDKTLSKTQRWKLVSYIRSLGKP